jgi:hypothetical protein
MQNPSPSQHSDQQAGTQHLQAPAVPQRATPTPKQATAPLPPQPVPTPVPQQPPPAVNTPTTFPTQMLNKFVKQLPPGQPGSLAVAPVTPAPVQRQVSQADIAQHQKLQLDMQQMEAYLKNVNAALHATAVASIKSPNDLGKLKQQGARYQMQLQAGRSHFVTLQQQYAVLHAKIQQAVPGTSSQTGRSTRQGVNVGVANGPAASLSPVRSSPSVAAKPLASGASTTSNPAAKRAAPTPEPTTPATTTSTPA